VLPLAPALLAIGLLLGLVVLLPARRLQLAGISSRWIGIYATCLWALGFFLAIRPVAIRFLLPILLIAYLAPFVVAPGRISSAIERRRRGGRGDPPPPPIKNVTPPDGPTGPA
jgi:hypothetical protein